MMENKSDKGGFWRRQSFLLPPLTAAVVLLCQQMASSNPSGVVTVNILLLVLNFFSYVGLLRGEKSTEKSVAIAAASFITLMAFVFNTCVAGIPTPLSDTGIFMNSLCGMWVLVAVVQGISLLIQAVLQPTVEQETGASETNVWNRLQKVGGQLKPKATNSQEIIFFSAAPCHSIVGNRFLVEYRTGDAGLCVFTGVAGKSCLVCHTKHPAGTELLPADLLALDT